MTFILIILLGWVSGWLVNYLTDVLPATRSFSRPTCPKCGQRLGWGDYLLYRNCGSCGARRGWRSLITQAVLTVGVLLLWFLSQNPAYHPVPFWLGYLILIYLAVVLIIDLEHRLILHQVSLFGAVLGLVTGIYLHQLIPTLLGGVAGFGVMLLFYFLGELYIRIRSKRTGLPSDEVALGFGDVNLSGILGLMLGWPKIVLGLFIGVIAGGLISLIIILGMLLAKRYKAFTAIPYAPFLILSAFLILFIIR